ncbi:MAG: hypothetical protein ACXWLO_04710, partial [Rhizomicrobium sp.]
QLEFGKAIKQTTDDEAERVQSGVGAFGPEEVEIDFKRPRHMWQDCFDDCQHLVLVVPPQE